MVGWSKQCIWPTHKNLANTWPNSRYSSPILTRLFHIFASLRVKITQSDIIKFTKIYFLSWLRPGPPLLRAYDAESDPSSAGEHTPPHTNSFPPRSLGHLYFDTLSLPIILTWRPLCVRCVFLLLSILFCRLCLFVVNSRTQTSTKVICCRWCNLHTQPVIAIVIVY